MQPYFFPYIGYFQLINEVDEFIVYDNIQFTKKGWINRNRYLQNCRDEMFSISLKKDSDYLDVIERKLADNYRKDAQKMLRQVAAAYQKAPYFKETYPIFEQCVLFNANNLFEYVYHSIVTLSCCLGISTKILISSEVEQGQTERLKGKYRVLNLCKLRNASHYINPIGGVELYDKKEFKSEGIQLSFLKANPTPYFQYGDEFVPYLSILDVLMFNGKEEINVLLKDFVLH